MTYIVMPGSGDPPSMPACGCPSSDAVDFQSADEALDWLRSVVVPVYGDVRSVQGLTWATSEIVDPARHGGARGLRDRFEAARRSIDAADPRPRFWKGAQS